MKRIKLNGKLGLGKYVLVDDADFDSLNKWKWSLSGRASSKYARRGMTRRKEHITKTILMHREILKPPKGFFTDHINGNKLDNRRCNLRICTIAENIRNRKINLKVNTSGYKGICWNKISKKWQAGIKFSNKYIYLGLFNNKEEGALAYNQAAIKYHGKFATLNKLEK